MRKFGALPLVAGLLWAGPILAARADATLPTWQPDPAEVAQLTDQDTATTYTIQLPKGAQGKHQVMQVTDANATQFVWTVSTNKNFEILSTIAMPNGTNPLPDPAAAIDTFESATVETCPDAVRTKKEVGNVDGLTVTRDRFTFTSPDGKHVKMAGFNYAVKSGTTLVIAGALTTDATKDKDLPLAEAAVLTLLKSVAKNP